MIRLVVGVVMLASLSVVGSELDVLPLGDPALALEIGSAGPDSFYDTAAGVTVGLDELAGRLVEADVVLIGEEHTAMDQKRFHAELLEAMAATGRPLILAMEFFLRDDVEALDRWVAGEIADRELLEATGWYDRGTYRWEYYEQVMDVARLHSIPVVGVNVAREIPRAVNRGGLDSLSDEQRMEVGEVTTDLSAEHRYLIARYFGDTVAALPPGWFDNMYAAQCLWDVVMARSILDVARDGATVVLIVGSGHIAYRLGIPERLEQERAAAGRPPLRVATICPATAPPPSADGEPTGHPMGGGGHGMGGVAGSPALFVRSLADIVAVFPDRGGVDAYPTLGLRLRADDEGYPVVSMVWPDTRAERVGFASGDRIVDLDGVEPANLGELRFLLAGLEWGRRTGLMVERGDETIEVGALLFPDVDISEPGTAPGYVVEPMTEVDPGSAVPVHDVVLAGDRSQWAMVTEDGTPVRAEVRRDGRLDEVHELDANARIVRTLLREAAVDGAVEIRYRRDDAGEVVTVERFDRAGERVE
jgi:uncharacterized iron-regulated protein